MKKSILPILWGAFLCIVILAFSSCENFLNNNNISEEIKNTIAYNNAQIVKVNLYCKEEMGTIYPDNYYDAHLGFGFKLQFIPNKNNYVVRNPEKIFEAVSRSDNSKSMSEYVQFTPIPQTDKDKEEGIYYSYVKVIKPSDDIRIRPIDDSSNPKFSTIRIARTKDDVLNSTNLIPYDEYEGEDSDNPNFFIHYANPSCYSDESNVAQNIQDHHVNKLWIYFEAEDAGSGVEYIEVKEQLVREIGGSVTQGIIYDKSNSEKTNCIYNTTGNNNYSACFEYNFISANDGVVNIELKVYDYAGNENLIIQKADFVKDTTINHFVNFTPNKSQSIEDYENIHEVEYDISISSQDPRLSEFIHDINGQYYADTVLSQSMDDFSNTVKILFFEYGYDINNMTVIDLQNPYFTNYEIIEQNNAYGNFAGYRKVYNIKFNADPYRTIYLKATTEDNAGNRKTSSKQITPIPDTVGADITIQNSNYIFINFLITNTTYKNSNGNLVPSKPEKSIRRSLYNDYEEITSYSFCNNMDFFGKPILLRKCKSDENQTANDTFEVVSESNQELTENDLPIVSISIDNPLNTGKKIISINLEPKTTSNSDNYYVINYYNEKGESFFTKEQTIEYSYATVKRVIYVYVYNNTGAFLKSDSYEVDITYDNISPLIENFYIRKIIQGKFIADCTITDENNYGSNRDNYGNSGIKITKYLFTEKSINREFIDWNNNTNVKLLTKNQDNMYEFDYSGFSVFPSCLYIFAEDNNNNYSVKELIISECHLDSVVDYEDYKFLNKTLNMTSYKTVFEYINKNEWKPIEGSETSYGSININLPGGNYIDGTAYCYNEIPITSTEKLSFIRIQPHTSLCISPVSYFYPPYIENKNTNNEIICELKGFALDNQALIFSLINLVSYIQYIAKEILEMLPKIG